MVTMNKSILELTVANHPGVMSHVCGLFARRAYNVDAIVCLPVGDGSCSRIWLLVCEDARLDQMVKQLLKLHDVQGVKRHPPALGIFQTLDELLSGNSAYRAQ